MADRRVNVRLTADANQYMATLAKAAAATKALADNVDTAQQKLNNAKRAEAAAAEQVRVAEKQLIAVRKSETASAYQIEKASRDLARARANLTDKTYDVEAATRKLTDAQKKQAEGVDKLWRDEAKRVTEQMAAINKKAAAEASAAKRREEAEKKRAAAEDAAEKRRAEADKKRADREAAEDKRRQDAATKRAMAEVNRIVAQEAADKKRIEAETAREEKAAERSVVAARKKADADAKAYAKEFKTTLERADEGDEAGHAFGGKIFNAIKKRIIFESPIIAAAIGAALLAGAPLMLAGAAMVFGGIAGVAGAQSLEVKKAWSDLGDEIARGSVQDARAVIPELVDMADDLGESFQNLRPQIREAFEATAPLLDHFVGGVDQFAHRSMPGFVSALENAGPAMEGFESFMGSLGGGMGEMFERMGFHAEAAGDAFEAWGDLFDSVLPLIGELMGQGAELATIILPPLTTAFDALTQAVEFLGPLLPTLLTGFLAFKAVKAIDGVMTGVATSIERMGARSFIGADRMGKFSAALGSVSGALPILGAALGVASYYWGENERNMQKNITAFGEWARAMHQGGALASEAVGEMAEARRGFDTMFGEGGGDAVFNSEQMNEARERGIAIEERRRDALTRSQRAAEDLSAAEYNLERALASSDPTDDAVALAAYEAALLEVDGAAGVTELAIMGVTAAMVAQADQAMAAIDSNFAYRKAEESLRDAQDGLTKAIEERNKAGGDARKEDEAIADALFKIEEQSYRTAVAFGQQQADLSGLEAGTAEYTRVIQDQTLKRLYELRDAAGPEMKGAIQTQINMLELNGVKLDQTTGNADATASAMRNLGASVTLLPGGKYIHIDAPTAEQKARIEELGIKTETLPDGDIRIDADTWPAHFNIDRLIGQYNGKTLTLNVAARVAAGATANSLGVNEIQGQTSWHANGSITRENHVAQIAPAGSWRVWGEPETGGEAYIPLSPSKRRRSVAIWQETGRRLDAYANGGIPMHVAADTRQAETDINSIALEQAKRIVASGIGGIGGGSTGGSWQALWARVSAAFPRARLTSSYRPGDPGRHGMGKAIDVAGAARMDTSMMYKINKWAAASMGANLAELIYTPGINLYRGRPHTYGAATRADHYDHVHMATYDTGGVMKSGTAGINLSGFPERVLNPRETAAYEVGLRGREFTSQRGGGGGGPMTAVVNARVFIGTREITDIARVQAEAVLVSATDLAERNARSSQ